MSQVGRTIAQQVRRRAKRRCEYCQTQERVVGDEFTVDHIIPRTKSGSDDPFNLALCCYLCNSFKGARTEARDPQTGSTVPLFHPRLQRWTDHFEWSDDGLRILGKTLLGRATLAALNLNRPSLLVARQTWVQCGIHPPP